MLRLLKRTDLFIEVLIQINMANEGHLVHRYYDGSESPVPVKLKSLGDGTVITRISLLFSVVD